MGFSTSRKIILGSTSDILSEHLLIINWLERLKNLLFHLIDIICLPEIIIFFLNPETLWFKTCCFSLLLKPFWLQHNDFIYCHMVYKQPTHPFAGVIVCSSHCHMTICFWALKQLGLFMGFMLVMTGLWAWNISM